MGDPTSRRNQTRNRLRAQLRKKRESLADQFDFKIYIAFVFKEKVCYWSRVFLAHFNSCLSFSSLNFLSNTSQIQMSFLSKPKIVFWFMYLCFVCTEEEVCAFWSCRGSASDDQQLWRKHPTRCAGFQLLTRELNRTPAKRCCATPRSPIPVDAKGKPAYCIGLVLEKENLQTQSPNLNL